jgi:DNA-binding SARP family transcriptional activator
VRDYRILGQLEVVDGDRTVSLGGARSRAVLAILVVSANQPVSAGRLIDEIWGERPPPTAGNLVQGHISDLRRALGRDAIETRGEAYVLHVAAGARDLDRFERLAQRGAEALRGDRPAEAAEAYAQALALWRGPALAEIAQGGWLSAEAIRLDEMRVLALERRIEADLACGRDAELVGEVRSLVAEHPLREPLRAHLALALYRAGRQVEALDVLREGRRELSEELGLDPGPTLQTLERAVLQHDPDLMLPSSRRADSPPARSILVAPLAANGVEVLAGLAAPLAERSGRELILAVLVRDHSELAHTARTLNATRDDLLHRGVDARSVSFTTAAAGDDIARIALQQDIDLLLVDSPPGLLDDPALATILASSPCDTGVLVGRPRDGPVLVPFSGADHDWAAIEIAAWLVSARGGALVLAGSAGAGPGQDASRLLASASLAVQRTIGIAAEPLLLEPEIDALTAAAEDMGVVVVGLSRRWQREGLGPTRSAVVAREAGATLLVRRGLRPGSLAPVTAETVFTWTIGA